MIRLTALVLAQDEEEDLPACLAALSFCDERLVIDGGSRDRTIELARSAGARVVENPWPGYGAQYQFGLNQAQGDYVLVVDADEVVDAELAGSVRRVLTEPAPKVGYRIRVANHFMGRELHFGGLGHDYHTRLFRREGASYVNRIHSGVQLEGPLGTLSGALQHRSYRDLSEYLTKTNRYTSELAVARHARGERFHPFLGALRLPWGFFRRYVLQLGFLDGYPGFVHAALSAFYDYLKVVKLWDLEVSASSTSRNGLK